MKQEIQKHAHTKLQSNKWLIHLKTFRRDALFTYGNTVFLYEITLSPRTYVSDVFTAVVLWFFVDNAGLKYIQAVDQTFVRQIRWNTRYIFIDLISLRYKSLQRVMKLATVSASLWHSGQHSDHVLLARDVYNILKSVFNLVYRRRISVSIGHWVAHSITTNWPQFVPQKACMC